MRVLVVLVALLAATTPAPAQQGAPYEGQLLRLSELMGALHYLRGVCGGSEGGAWRERMAALIESETQDVELKEKLAGSFNRGFRTFELTYRTCNDQARRIVEAYLEEGQRIAGEIANRYSN